MGVAPVVRGDSPTGGADLRDACRRRRNAFLPMAGLLADDRCPRASGVQQLRCRRLRLGERTQDRDDRWRHPLPPVPRGALDGDTDLPRLRTRGPVPEGPRDPSNAPRVEAGRIRTDPQFPRTSLAARVRTEAARVTGGSDSASRRGPDPASAAGRTDASPAPVPTHGGRDAASPFRDPGIARLGNPEEHPSAKQVEGNGDSFGDLRSSPLRGSS